MDALAVPTPALSGQLLVVGLEPAVARFRHLASQLVFPTVSYATGVAEARACLIGRRTEAIVIVTGAANPEAFGLVQALAAGGEAPLILIAPAMTDEEDLLALRLGAVECLADIELTGERLLLALTRARARGTHIARWTSRAALFQALVDRDADGMVALDADLRITYASAGVDRLVGYSETDMIGRTILEFVTPESTDQLLRCIVLALAGPGEHLQGGAVVRHADGTDRRLEGSIVNLLGDAPVHALVASFRDATERHRRDLTLQQSEAQFRALAESVPVMVWEDDAAHRLVYQNRTADAFSGRLIDEEAGTAWFAGIHPDDRAKVIELYRETGERPVPYQSMHRLRRADGQWRWVIEIGVPRQGPDGSAAGFVGVDVDIHDLKEASTRLEQAEARYRHFIDQSTEGIWRLEVDPPVSISLPPDEQIELWFDRCLFAECNLVMAKMYGFNTPEELYGARLRDLMPPGDAANVELLRAFIASGYRLINAESHELDREGRPKYFLNNLVGVVENGCLVRSWGTQQDITERRLLEDEARQVRKMETAGRLAGGIAHDFNNLLTAILGTSEILLHELPPGVPQRDDVEEIKRAATRAANLTRQLLAFSRRQVLQPRILDLEVLVRGVESMLGRLIGEHITLSVQSPPDLWRVRADPGQLEQVIVNLCVNARDAMPTGGHLQIGLQNYSWLGVLHGPESIMPVGQYLLLTVTDDGTGMDEETLRHLFEPFFTTKEQGKGTGLGLATVYGIVKQSGGFIYADSEPGKGSRFRIYLPRVEGAVDALDSTAVPPAPAAVAGGTILLVEDDEAVRRLARRVLEDVGYRVLEAGNGREALALAERWRGPLDLVVTDVIMPEMSGQQLSARLRESRPGLPILYVSGYTDDTILQHGNLLPNTAFLQKPFSPGSLAARVREVLRKGERPE